MARGYLVSGLLSWMVGALVGCGSDDDSASGAGSGGSGSSKSTAADVTATCEPGTAKLSYDGGAEQPYDVRGWPAPFGYPTPGTFHVFDPLGDGYYDMVISPVLDDALVAAAEPFPLYFKEGAPGEIVKGFIAQATDETLGPIHCVAEGSGSTIARKGDDLLFDLKNADVIAACGDNPVEGQINLCFQFGG
ncbi:MAG TPA: hypothetical protein VGP93_02845, partial [Polyangiaceae bacterium]|nr:hypothetical protein [Polyangiaceae bacterium]